MHRKMNVIDCGIFIFCYAYAMYYFRVLNICNKDVFEEQPALMNKISWSPYFSFNQSEVTRFRAKLALLLKGLNKVVLNKERQ